MKCRSPLTQGRGLKFVFFISLKLINVAPHAGAWIEIHLNTPNVEHLTSPLTQGRGLKSATSNTITALSVAPHAGAWIEIDIALYCPPTDSRPSRRGVD